MCHVNRCGFKGNCQHGLLAVKAVRHLALALFLDDNYDNDDAVGEKEKKHRPTDVAYPCRRTTPDLSEGLVLFNTILHLGPEIVKKEIHKTISQSHKLSVYLR